MLDFLAYSFFQRGLITGILISIVCAILGIFVVLKKNSFISEGLAHISFTGFALGFFLGFDPTISSIVFTLFASLLLSYFQEKSKLKDAIIGIISYTGFAVGIILISLSKGYNSDIFSYLFGNILTVSFLDLVFSIILFILVSSFIVLFFNQLALITFDEDSAKISGINVKLFNYIIGILIGLTVVLSIRIIGIILVASFMIIPSTSALNISKSFKQSFFYSIFFSLLSLIIGLFLSYNLDLAVGATIVVVSFFIFLLTKFFSKLFS